MQTTVKVRVTVELQFSQPFGEEWKMGDVCRKGIAEAKDVANQWASSFKSGRATVVSVDPNVTLLMQDEKR